MDFTVFHMSTLPPVITKHIGDIGNKRVIVAHLGNGASMCAMQKRKSVATSMGLTAIRWVDDGYSLRLD